MVSSTKVYLPTSATTAERDALPAVPNGTRLYNTDTLREEYTTDGGTTWLEVANTGDSVTVDSQTAYDNGDGKIALAFAKPFEQTAVLVDSEIALGTLYTSTVVTAGGGGITNYTIGWRFNAQATFQTSKFYVFDPPADRDVGLWKLDGTLLATATVTNTDPISSIFGETYREVAMSAPVILESGQDYVIGVQVGGEGTKLSQNPASNNLDATYFGSTFRIRRDATNDSVFEFPLNDVGGNPQGWFSAMINVELFSVVNALSSDSVEGVSTEFPNITYDQPASLTYHPALVMKGVADGTINANKMVVPSTATDFRYVEADAFTGYVGVSLDEATIGQTFRYVSQGVALGKMVAGTASARGDYVSVTAGGELDAGPVTQRCGIALQTVAAGENVYFQFVPFDTQ